MTQSDWDFLLLWEIPKAGTSKAETECSKVQLLQVLNMKDLNKLKKAMHPSSQNLEQAVVNSIDIYL